ncbi:MAG: hypothetical protein M0T70_00965 [Geobacteraceae bacterium]|nr:hypothetical protein [Geobacteraceae bacterium]
MKCAHLLILTGGFFLLCSCSLFYAKQPASAPVAAQPKPLAVPLGKHWQVIEEAPKISDERGRLPFQTPKSVQPEGDQNGSPDDNRTIEVPH